MTDSAALLKGAFETLMKRIRDHGGCRLDHCAFDLEAEVETWGQQQREAGFQRGLREAQLTQPGRDPAPELRGENITGHATVPAPESLAERIGARLKENKQGGFSIHTNPEHNAWMWSAEAIDALTALVERLRRDAIHLDEQLGELDARSRSRESSPRGSRR